MYQFVDRPLTSLDEGCQFLVWSMRGWVTGLGQGRGPAQLLGPAFARRGIIGALQPFHRTMLMLNRDALETLRFCPVACPRVSEHEAILLETLTSLRERGPAQTRATLDLLVAEETVGDMLESLSRLGAAMAIAGIFPCAPAAAPGHEG